MVGVSPMRTPIAIPPASARGFPLNRLIRIILYRMNLCMVFSGLIFSSQPRWEREYTSLSMPVIPVLR
jgi:hypothetical protein